MQADFVNLLARGFNRRGKAAVIRNVIDDFSRLFLQELSIEHQQTLAYLLRRGSFRNMAASRGIGIDDA